MPKKTERGDPLGFFNIHSVAKHQKNAGGTLWGKSVSQCRKTERGDHLGFLNTQSVVKYQRS